MDNAMIFVSVLLVAVIFTPFFYFGFLGGKKSRSLKHQVKEILKKQGYSLSSKEYWGNRFLGIDAEKRVLIFVGSGESEMDVTEIDLRDLTGCSWGKQTERIKTNSGNGNQLVNLELELYFQQGKSATRTLRLYDRDEELQEDFEEQRAERWVDTIKACLQPKGPIRSAA